jgi:hypothetical protein
MSLMDVEPGLLRCPDACIDDFMTALARINPSVTEEDLHNDIMWIAEFGEEN